MTMIIKLSSMMIIQQWKKHGYLNVFWRGSLNHHFFLRYKRYPGFFDIHDFVLLPYMIVSISDFFFWFNRSMDSILKSWMDARKRNEFKYLIEYLNQWEQKKRKELSKSLNIWLGEVRSHSEHVNIKYKSMLINHSNNNNKG